MIVREGWPYRIPKGEFPSKDSKYCLIGCGHIGKIVYVSDDKNTIGVECYMNHHLKDLSIVKKEESDLSEKKKIKEWRTPKKKTKSKNKERIIFLIEV